MYIVNIFNIDQMLDLFDRELNSIKGLLYGLIV